MPDAQTFSGIGIRVVSGVTLAGVAIAAALAGGWTFVAVVVVAAVAMIREWVELCLAGAGARPLWRAAPPIAAVAFVVLGLLALGLLVLGHWRQAAALALAGALAVAAFAPGRVRDRLLLGAGLPYIVLPSAALLWLAGDGRGAVTVLWIFAVVWATDIGGYLFGKLIGGPKLAARVSPNKTWAGLVGGAALASAAAAGFVFAVPQAGASRLALIGLGVSLAAQAGDLLESAVKRHFAVKDSGSIIPGHGGVFDRVDGLLAAAPLVAVLAAAHGDLGFLWR